MIREEELKDDKSEILKSIKTEPITEGVVPSIEDSIEYFKNDSSFEERKNEPAH